MIFFHVHTNFELISPEQLHIHVHVCAIWDCMYFEHLVLRTIQVVTKSFVNYHSEILDGQQIFLIFQGGGQISKVIPSR